MMKNYNIRLLKKNNYFLLIYLHIFSIILLYFSFFTPTFIEAEKSSSITNSTQDILNKANVLQETNSTQDILNKANVLQDLQRYDEALQYYDKVLEIDPKDIDALYDKASVLEDLQRYDEALQYYDKVLDIDPKDIDAMNNKMDILSINNTKLT
jgi:tetratricopeptide (TPR) repeat protein